MRRSALRSVRLALAFGLLGAALLAPGAARAAGDCAPGGEPLTTQCSFRYPITVGGYEVRQTYAIVPNPQVDGHITRMEVDIVDGDGTPVPIQRLMLHHIVFLNASRPDPTCGSYLGFDNRRLNLGAPQRFYAAGEERAKLALPQGYGYPTRENDLWAMTYMVMNHRAQTDQAYIQYKVSYVPSPNDAGLTDVTPYWLDVRNCRADPIYNVPGTGRPGSTEDVTADYKMPESGRIVAGAGHVHGGARKLTLTEPSCDNRRLAQSVPTWGRADHPFYHVRPVLHEPGPVNMSAFKTEAGIPVKAGETLRLNSLYEDSRPHVRVMGIMVVFVARDPGVRSRCGAIPGDLENFGTNYHGRKGPIPFRIPLTGIDPGTGTATTIRKPPGSNVRLGDGAEIAVRDRYFSRPNVVVKAGTRLNWSFGGYELHNLTLANGPVGIGSPNLDRNPDGSRRDFAYRFSRPGTYRFFCALHPTQMQERVLVKPRR